jgi:arylamine N-acetyltransferase/SAM-dependent methyltransferase
MLKHPSDLGKEPADIWLSDDQVSTYLNRIEVIQQRPNTHFLRAIVSGTITHLPFQNLSMLTRERIRPSPEQICSDMVSGIGGLCTVRNPFLFHLLSKLGFNVRYVSVDINKQACHIALLVNIDGDDWWVDVGNGFPYHHPVRLGDGTPIIHSFLQYRLIYQHNRWEVQHCRNGLWKTNYHFSSEGVDYSTFDEMHESHYSQPGWGPFLTGLRVNRWGGEDYAILRDNIATSPDGEEIIDTPEKVQGWISKWFPKSGFLENVNVTAAFYMWKFEVGLLRNSNENIEQIHELVGGNAEERGPWHLDLMNHFGLEPHHRLLDVGCGTLRGGIHLIPFLEAEKYVGIDPNPLFIRIAQRLIQETNLQHLKPRITNIDNFESNDRFDFILTQSVLNHLNEDQLHSLVDKIRVLLESDGTWISTVYFDSNIDTIQSNSPHPFRPNESVNSRFNPEWFESLLLHSGFSVEVISDLIHPHHNFSIIAIKKKKEEK